MQRYTPEADYEGCSFLVKVGSKELYGDNPEPVYKASEVHALLEQIKQHCLRVHIDPLRRISSIISLVDSHHTAGDLDG